MKQPKEFERFDAGMKVVLSVSREELKRREAEWKQERAEKRATKAASPAPVVPAKRS
jgi:hypothetical protein